VLSTSAFKFTLRRYTMQAAFQKHDISSRPSVGVAVANNGFHILIHATQVRHE
jgi:hypothetical protein